VVSGWNYNTVRLRAREHPISQTSGRFLVGQMPQTWPLFNGGRWNESPNFDGLTGQDHAILPADEKVQRYDEPYKFLLKRPQVPNPHHGERCAGMSWATRQSAVELSPALIDARARALQQAIHLTRRLEALGEPAR
jgi:hypothetical protein